jgi:hypothetical protein
LVAFLFLSYNGRDRYRVGDQGLDENGERG